MERMQARERSVALSEALHVPNIVWSYWHSGTAVGKKSQIISACVASWRKTLPSWDIRILCASDVERGAYGLTSASLVSRDFFRSCTPQVQADLVRLAVLELFGGLWLDCSVLLGPGMICRVMEASARTTTDLWVFSVLLRGCRIPLFETSFILCRYKSRAIGELAECFRRMVAQYESAIPRPWCVLWPRRTHTIYHSIYAAQATNRHGALSRQMGEQVLRGHELYDTTISGLRARRSLAYKLHRGLPIDTPRPATKLDRWDRASVECTKVSRLLLESYASYNVLVVATTMLVRSRV
jgi:hypothetical protein